MPFEGFVDARFTEEKRRQMHSPSPQPGIVDKFLGFKFHPAEVPSGGIAVEIDEFRVVTKTIPELDFYTGEVVENEIEVISGGGERYLPLIEEHVTSAMCFRRATNGVTLSREVESFYRAIDRTPGNTLVLTDREGLILDGWSVDQKKWEFARRAAAKLPDGASFFLAPPFAPKRFPFRGGKGSSGWWTWALMLRELVDGDKEHWNPDEPRVHGRGCGLVGPRSCRPVQNLHELPTLEESYASRKIPLRWAPGGEGQLMRHLFELDCKLRSEQLEGGATRYGDSGTLRTELLPTAGVDWESPVRRPPV
jgi:hypothetical protein